MTRQQTRPVGVPVWHLCGAQGSGKSVYAETFSRTLTQATRPPAIEVDCFELQQIDGRMDRLQEDHGATSVVMVAHNDLAEGDVPPYFMKGDRVMGFPSPANCAQLRRQAGIDAQEFMASVNGVAQ